MARRSGTWTMKRGYPAGRSTSTPPSPPPKGPAIGVKTASKSSSTITHTRKK